MRTHRPVLTLVMLSLLAPLAACEDGGPTAPVEDDLTVEELGLNDDVALDVMADEAMSTQSTTEAARGSRRAALAVAFAGEAVGLATRILDEQVPAADTRQRDFLAKAQGLLAAAQRALESEEYARAVELAHQAQWFALKAVVIPGGVTEEDARFMVELAEHLYAQAREAIGPEPTDFQAALLARAARLIENGKAKLEGGSFRGIGALWKAAVLSSWLLGS